MTRIEEFEEYLKTKPTKAGKEYSRKYIMNLICYCRLLEKFCDGEVTIEKVNEFTKARRLQPTAVRSISTYLKFLGFKSEELRSEASGGRLYIPPRRVKRQLAERILAKEEMAKLVESVANIEDRLILRLLYDTACRSDEFLRIELKDIDFANMRIIVHGKGGKDRPVGFMDNTRQDLMQYIKERNIRDGRIFDMKYQTLWYRIKSLGKRILGKLVTPHDLRHSKLTHLAEDRMPVFSIQQYAGHEDLEVTRGYIKIAEQTMMEDYKKFSREI